MKKFAIFFLTILMLVLLVACDEGADAPSVCQHRDADDNSLCDKCGEAYTDGVDVTPEHTHTFGAWEQTIAPTCQVKGEEKRTCTCGTPETRPIEKDMTNHVAWGAWSVTTPATCQAEGVETRTCACGTPETRGIGATGAHVYNQKVKQPTYLKCEATSECPATYYYSCTCGAKGTEAFYDGYVLCYTLTSDYSFRVVSGIIGEATEIEIPIRFDGLRVVAIAEGAFQNNTTLQKIVLPNTIESIGHNAFAGCTALVQINLPTSISEIGSTAFKGCTALEYIEIPGSIATLPEALFQDCSKLKTVVVNEGLVTIGNLVFDNCKALQSFTMPGTVTTLGNMAFRHAEALASINFSEKLTAIGNAAFQYCVNLANVELHAGITVIGNSAFSYCDGLQTLRILGNIALWGNSAFYECQSLTSVYLACALDGDMGADNYIFYNAGIKGNGITLTLAQNAVVPERLFEPFGDQNCPKVTAVVIEAGATTVNAFKTYNHLPYLISVTYPNTITDAAYGAWNDSPWWQAQPIGRVYIGEAFYGYKCHCLVATPLAAVEENRIEPLCTVDGSCDMVVYCYVCGVELERTVYTVAQLGHAPDSAWASDGTHHWHKCTNEGCKVEFDKAVHTPSTTWATTYTHHWHDCTVCGYDVSRAEHSYDAENTCECLHYKDSGVWFTLQSGTYAVTDYTGSATAVVIPSKYNGVAVTAISSSAFKYCTSLTSIEIPASVISIGEHAFYGCTGLTSIAIPSNVTYIAFYAFYGCTGLTSIAIPASVTSIGERAFSGCSRLISVTFGENSKLTSIGYYSFFGCKGLTSITIPASVTSISERAFEYCTGLTSVTLAEGSRLTKIGVYAFSDCTSLTSITIPASVTSIGKYAFSDCTSLESVTFVETSGWYASSYYDTIGTEIFISNGFRAAAYLTEVYCDYYWKRL